MLKLATLKDLEKYNEENNMDEMLYYVILYRYTSIGEDAGSIILWKTNNYKETLEKYHDNKYYHACERCKITLERAMVQCDPTTHEVNDIYLNPRFTFTTTRLKKIFADR